MHKPTLYGDDLTGIRHTIEYVNKTQTPIDTFEEGVVFYGFRFVYPLFVNQTYVGCMEASFGASAFTSSLMNEYYVLSNFYVKEGNIKKKNIDLQSSVYVPSHHEGFYYDKKVLSALKSVARKDMKKLVPSSKTTQQIRIMGMKNDPSSLYDKDINAIFTIIPIINSLSGENVAYLTIRSKSDDIITSERYILAIYVLTISLIWFILFVIYLFIVKKSSLEEEVKNRTFELKELNSHLEEKVDEKVSEIKQNYKMLEKLSKDLQEEEHKYKTILELASNGIVILNLDGTVFKCSNKAASMLGFTKEEMLQLAVYDWDIKADREKFDAFVRKLQGMKESIVFESKHLRKDASTLDVEIEASIIEINSQRYIYAAIKDKTKEKKLEEQLLNERNFAFSVLNNSNMTLLTDGKTLVFANKVLLDFFNVATTEEFKKSYRCVCNHFVHNDKYFHLGKITNESEWLNEIIKLPEEERVVSLISQQTYEPKAFHLNVTAYDENLFLINFTDVSEQILKQLNLESKVIHDKLTNAYNREYFEIHIQKHIAHNKQVGNQTGIVMVDIDYFKNVNDTYGHDIGDDVLIHLVQTLKKHSRETDILIRWGGEEFLIILGIKDENFLYKIIDNYRKIIEQVIFKRVHHITCSFGGTLYRQDEKIEATIKRADEALYEAKANGRNCVIVKT